MALSNDLISSFVKVAKNDSNKKKTETTVYGTTVKRDGRMWVKIDGSELLTPISSTAEVRENERVTVMVKNHTATITGNMSSPAVRTGTVDEVKKIVDESVNSVTYMYALSPSTVIAPTDGWTSTIPPIEEGMYMWQKTIATLNTGRTSESDPVCLAGGSGTPGEPGKQGPPGRSVVSITTQFCITISKDAVPGDDAVWFDTMPDWSEGDYLWIRSAITYADPDGVEYTEPQCDCSWEAVNSVDEKLDRGLEDVSLNLVSTNKRIDELPGQITETFETEYVKSTEFVDYKKTVSSDIEKSAEGITATFTTVEERVSKIENGVVPEVNKISNYVRINEQGHIILGSSENPIVLTIENDELHFSQNGVKVCYISDTKMGIPTVDIVKEAYLAGLRFYRSESNDSICIN